MLEAYGYPDALHLVSGKLEKPVELKSRNLTWARALRAILALLEIAAWPAGSGSQCVARQDRAPRDPF